MLFDSDFFGAKLGLITQCDDLVMTVPLEMVLVPTRQRPLAVKAGLSPGLVLGSRPVDSQP